MPGEDAKQRKSPQNTANSNRPLRSKRKRDTARKLRRDMTEVERRLWSLLRNRKLAGCKFRRQVTIGAYIADFLSFEVRLIVEADGGQHAEAPHDEQRDAWLAERGYRVMRFWNCDILDNPDGVLARLAESAQPEKEFIQ